MLPSEIWRERLKNNHEIDEIVGREGQVYKILNIDVGWHIERIREDRIQENIMNSNITGLQEIISVNMKEESEKQR